MKRNGERGLIIMMSMTYTVNTVLSAGAGGGERMEKKYIGSMSDGSYWYRRDEVDARIAELEAENAELKKQIETINALAGEPMPDIITRTST